MHPYKFVFECKGHILRQKNMNLHEIKTFLQDAGTLHAYYINPK